jgi:5-methylcytosine-specific restriction endonuclease McrA
MKRKSIPSNIRMIVFERDNFICQSCGVKTHNKPLIKHKIKCNELKTHQDYEKYLKEKIINKPHNSHKACVDHIIPYSLYGEDNIDNYQTLCNDCNLMKHNKPYPKGFNIKLYTLFWELEKSHNLYINQICIENEKGFCRLTRFEGNSKNRKVIYHNLLNEYRNYINEIKHMNFKNEWLGLFTKQQEKHFRSYPRTSIHYYPVKTKLSIE